MDSNPYRPPLAQVRDMPESEADAESIAQLGSGQKLAIYAICTYIGTALVRVLLTALLRSSLEDDDLFLIGLFAGAAFLVAFVLSAVGQWRMADGLGISVGLRVLMVILLFIPLVNIVMLLILSSRSTRALRQAGYRVGFFGAPDLPS
jgi:hypothetical protein